MISRGTTLVLIITYEHSIGYIKIDKSTPLITIGETVAPTTVIVRFRLKLRKDFQYALQSCLSPFPGSLFDELIPTRFHLSFYSLDPNHTRISLKIQFIGRKKLVWVSESFFG